MALENLEGEIPRQTYLLKQVFSLTYFHIYLTKSFYHSGEGEASKHFWRSKLDPWLQMNEATKKIPSFQVLGQIFHEN